MTHEHDYLDGDYQEGVRNRKNKEKIVAFGITLGLIAGLAIGFML